MQQPPDRLHYPTVTQLSQSVPQQLSHCMTQLPLWERRLLWHRFILLVLGLVTVIAFNLSFAWGFPALLLLSLHALSGSACSQPLAQWQRCQQTLERLGSLAEALQRLGLSVVDVVANCVPLKREETLLWRKEDGSEVEKLYQVRWVSISSPGLKVRLLDTLHELERSGACPEYGAGSSCDTTPSSSVELELTRTEHRSLERLRHRIYSHQAGRRPKVHSALGSLKIVWGWDQEANPGLLLEALAWFSLWSRTLDRPVDAPCPGCDTELVGGGCQNCGGAWVGPGTRLEPCRRGRHPAGARLCPCCDRLMEVEQGVDTCPHCLGFWVSRNFSGLPSILTA
ncbi:MAG: hypothetical protein AMXMBFR33_03160 [Candidatus Xenobia bacterium]